MKTFAIVNQKGGVGKTVTSVNLAVGLATKGKKVLVIDFDPQGSLTVSLGYSDQDKLTTTVTTVLEKIISDIPIERNEGILHHPENIDLLPANIELSAMEVSLVNIMSRETVLKTYINALNEIYDYVVIDCSPSLGMLTINALTCADEVIIPVQPQYLSLKGMEQLFKTIGKVKRQLNPCISISGILITMVDIRSNYTKDIIDLLKDTYKNKINIFNSMIPMSVRAAEISAEGKSIYTHDPKGKVAISYGNFVEEVINEK